MTEAGLAVFVLVSYWHRSRGDRSFGGRALTVVAVILVLHLLNSPLLS